MRFLSLLCLLPLVAQAAKPPLPPLTVPEGLGVNIHFTTPRPGEMKMLAEAGFKFIRMDLSWGGTERKKGEYDFSAYDRLIESLAPHNIRALFILDYSNKNYDNGLSPFSDEGRAAFAAWSAAAAKHFAGKGILWEMYNEPNIHFWKPKPNVEHYTKLALAVGKALRQAAPDELYVGPATSQIDLKFLEDCFKAGCLEYWDAVTVHPYRQKDPETANEEYRNLRLLIAKYAPKGKTIPILSGEWGYSAAWARFDEVRQGKYLPRQFLVNLYNQVPVSIWYDWHDDGKDPKEAEHHFGTVSFEYRKDQPQVYAPKDAYKAAQTLTSQLAGYKYNKRLWTGDEADWVLLFDKGPDVKLAVWTTRKEGREITIPASAGKFTAVSYMGESTKTIEAGKDGLKLAATDMVQYLTPQAPNDVLRVAAAWERAPLEILGKAPQDAVIELGLKNPLRRRLSVGIDGKAKDIVAGQAVSVTRRMAISRAVVSTPVEAELVVDGGAQVRQVSRVITVNPLKVDVLTQGYLSLIVRIQNPSGEPFSGMLKLKTVKELYWPEAEKELDFEKGETERELKFELGCNSHGGFVVKGTVMDSDGKLVLEVPQRSYRFITPWNYFKEGAEKEFSLAVDGDRAVKSEQSVALVKCEDQAPGLRPETGLKIVYSFDPGWKFIRLVPTKDDLKKIEGKPKQLGLWLYGDESGNQVRLRFIDAQGEVFQPHGVTLNFKGWKWVTIPMDGTEAGHWGKEDGVVQYPIRWDTFLLIDSAHRKQTSGEVWAAGLTLIE